MPTRQRPAVRAMLTIACAVLLLVLGACQPANEANEPSETNTTENEATMPEGNEAPAEDTGADEPAEAPAEDDAADEATTAQGGDMLAAIRERGELICGVNGQLPGFSFLTTEGEYSGFDVDYCRAVAVAVLGDPTAVSYRPLTAQERFTALQTGEVDVLIRNTTHTLTRDTENGLDFAPTTFYDGQGVLVRRELGITSLEELAGASICVQSGTTTEKNLGDAMRRIEAEYEPVVFQDPDQTFGAYDEGRCDAVTSDKSQLASRQPTLAEPDAHEVLDLTLSKEPLAPGVLQGDAAWADLVSWVVWGTIQAEEFGIGSDNVDELASSEAPEIRRFLGTEGALGEALGVDNDFMAQVIREVGNYGEIYDRNLGPDTSLNLPRGPNRLWTDGGLLYAPPFR